MCETRARLSNICGLKMTFLNVSQIFKRCQDSSDEVGLTVLMVSEGVKTKTCQLNLHQVTCRQTRLKMDTEVFVCVGVCMVKAKCLHMISGEHKTTGLHGNTGRSPYIEQKERACVSASISAGFNIKIHFCCSDASHAARW